MKDKLLAQYNSIKAQKERNKRNTFQRDLRIQHITAKRFNLKAGDEWPIEAILVLQSKLPHLFQGH